MKKTYYFLATLFILLFQNVSDAQNIGINATGATPDASAGLDVSFTNKGLLVPRVALNSTNVTTPITSPATSLIVYNTATSGTFPNSVTPGYYYWGGLKWTRLSNSDDWTLLGNANTDPSINFLGTTDNQDFVFKTNNTEKVRIMSGGNVGIGTNNPAYKLEVKGSLGVVTTSITNRLSIEQIDETDSGLGSLTSIITGQQRGVLIKDRGNLQGGLWLLGGDNNADNSRGAIGMGWIGDLGNMRTSSTTPSAIIFSDGNMSFYTDQNKIVGNVYTGTSFTNSERMKITNTGNVGIGTTSPISQFQVANDARIGLVSPIGSGTLPSFGAPLYFSGGGASGSFDSDNSDPVYFARYNVANDVSELRLNLSDDIGNGDAFVIQGGGFLSAANTVFFKFESGGTAYKPGGGSWAALSDERLKRNVSEFKTGLNILKNRQLSN
jgi:hypothetical protein